MLIVEAEVPDLVREKYAQQRPDWKVLDISLVARRFGGFMAVVACEKVAAPTPEGAARFADEICYIDPKGGVTYFTDIASFANFLIWYERRSIYAKWLNPYVFFRCLYVVALIAAAYGLDVALEGGSSMMAIGAVVSVVCLSMLVILQPSE